MTTKNKQKWYELVVAGDMLQPHPLWNETEREPNQLNCPTEILLTKRAQCQTGVLFLVKTKNGMQRELSAGWFLPPTDKQEA